MGARSATARTDQTQSSSNVSTPPVTTQEPPKPSHQPNKQPIPQKKQAVTYQPSTIVVHHKAEQDDQQLPVSWIDQHLHGILS